MDTEAPLRRDVCLLGQLLGQVLVEQEGPALLEAVERIRLLSKQARESGLEADRERLAAAVRALEPEQQAQVLRAFGLYFQLANLAEQHHRLRRRRAIEQEARAPRESLAEAFALLAEAAVGDEALQEAAARLSLELVLTAHPTEATRRGTLTSHLALSELLARLEADEAVEGELAEEITVFWQSDEVRPVRPRVVDEIRHVLWFFETSLLEDACRFLRAGNAPA